MTEPDPWGRSPAAFPTSDTERGTQRRGPVWAVLRGFIFLPGMVISVILTYILAFTGLHFTIVLANLLFVPLAIICWIQSSVGERRDLWTAVYVGAMAFDYFLVGVAVHIFI